MNPMFVDTGYLLVLEIANDQHHQVAAHHWQRIVTTLPSLVTTSYVFDKVVTFLNSRGHHAKAVQIGNDLLRSASLQLIHVDEGLFYEGWTYLQQHQDKDYSLTDCISFVVMQRLSINTAFAFDRHFVQAGFTKEP
jgi:uncharacterized protein